jgi:4-aminobutyrate aminotransferase-like enzyme
MSDEAAGGAEDWRERRRQLQDAVERHMIRYIGDFPPFFIERAEGSYVFDDRGRRILDFTSGQMCATLGHNHPAVVAAIQGSCESAIHLFSWLLAPQVVELCQELGLSMNIVSLPGLASVWRIAPPLTSTEAQIDEGVSILDQALRESV